MFRSPCAREGTATPATPPVQGSSVAGIGVGGAPSGDLDEKYAKAGLATLR
ncbi:hypothetical protein [Lentzea jiangxiensis]|uniref:hypothetical protein n=1 Tax=Lentzea jiangxiensis TaxID=641025 RepID=UPI001FDEFA36|nr:hypothetical protein [Lentzea jiangxiensis]